VQWAEEKFLHQIMFTNSVAVYGFIRKQADEKGGPDPFNVSGQPKADAEEVFKYW
jgi:hypothetical protein